MDDLIVKHLACYAPVGHLVHYWRLGGNCFAIISSKVTRWLQFVGFDGIRRIPQTYGANRHNDEVVVQHDTTTALVRSIPTMKIAGHVCG
jgi:hypothetical protein